MEAVKKESFVPMAFFKKEAYTGSFKGMRYRVIKSEDQFVKNTFPFTEEGRESVVNWLNDQYDSRKAEWDSAAR